MSLKIAFPVRLLRIPRRSNGVACSKAIKACLQVARILLYVAAGERRCCLLFRDKISLTTSVHDEEEGVSLRLSLLLEQPANKAKLEAARITHAWKLKKPTAGD